MSFSRIVAASAACALSLTWLAFPSANAVSDRSEPTSPSATPTANSAPFERKDWDYWATSYQATGPSCTDRVNIRFQRPRTDVGLNSGADWYSPTCDDWWVKGADNTTLTGPSMLWKGTPGSTVVVEMVDAPAPAAYFSDEIVFSTPDFDKIDDDARSMVGLTAGDLRFWLRMRGDGTTVLEVKHLGTGKDTTVYRDELIDESGAELVLPSNRQVTYSCWSERGESFCWVRSTTKDGMPGRSATADMASLDVPDDVWKNELRGFALVGNAGEMPLSILSYAIHP